MGIGDWGLGIGDWGLGIGNKQKKQKHNTHKYKLLAIKNNFKFNLNIPKLLR